MYGIDLIFMWVSLLIPLATTLFCMVYGILLFFKKKKPLFVQSLTMSMGAHSLGTIYQLCITLSTKEVLEGFTPAYLGHLGFFLFILTASYGQLDRIVDDGSKEMRPARFIAFLAPAFAALLYVPNTMIPEVPTSTKIAYALTWIPAMITMYFNLKHAIIPDLDFNFVKAIRPYNIFALCLGVAELLYMTAWCYLRSGAMLVTSVIFSVLCVLTMIAAKKGVEKWII